MQVITIKKSDRAKRANERRQKDLCLSLVESRIAERNKKASFRKEFYRVGCINYSLA